LRGLLIDLQREFGRGVADLVRDPREGPLGLSGEHRPVRRSECAVIFCIGARPCLARVVGKLSRTVQHTIPESIGIGPTAALGAEGVVLTDQLGDVMKEWARIALSHVRGHAEELGIEDAFENKEFHVHVPASAIPKDGPSVGCDGCHYHGVAALRPPVKHPCLRSPTFPYHEVTVPCLARECASCSL
jgi:hypothetical protein